MPSNNILEKHNQLLQAKLAEKLAEKGFDFKDVPYLPILKDWEQLPIIIALRASEKETCINYTRNEPDGNLPDFDENNLDHRFCDKAILTGPGGNVIDAMKVAETNIQAKIKLDSYAKL